MDMAWKIIFDPDFRSWYTSQEEELKDEINAVIEVLENRGPLLGRPYVETLKNSSLPNLKELRIQYKGKPWRILFVFDPIRQAILLIGGNKSGEKKWYESMIPVAEKRYARHLKELEKMNVQNLSRNNGRTAQRTRRKNPQEGE